MANARVSALKELVKKLSNETGKKWPNLNNAVLASGTNGIIIRTRNDPNKLLKVAAGNVLREPQALRNLSNSGFVPKLNNNYVPGDKQLCKQPAKFPEADMRCTCTCAFVT